ncbi:IS110 family transposase, partial [Neisseria meningitidis]|nr:IS110 family transposase [Neisseria meningitidis]MBW3909068.1 IS110 family transposase [Neisseria meningitidis]MBW3937486.1 IS110 family transposase [Neisseria meningitidis]
TVAATRFEPLIRDFHQRLPSEGKPYKVAVTACMRKLLETFAKFLSLPTTETPTQVFGCFRFKYPLILPKYPLNPPRIPDNQASGPPFRRQQAHLACWRLSKGSNTSLSGGFAHSL